MDKGRIEQVGTPSEVYDSPATAFVHGFIGEFVLPVEISDGHIRLGDQSLGIAADGALPGASKLFVRRHDMQVGPAGSSVLEGRVAHVRAFGPIQRAEVALMQGHTTIEIDAPRDRELRAGDIIGLKAPPLPDFRVRGLKKFTLRPRLVCNNGPSFGADLCAGWRLFW